MSPLFQTHKLNDNGFYKAKEIAVAFNSLLIQLEHLCPIDNREFSIVKTKLEEACFYAKKTMANESINQEGGL